jgi:hypothetical protein
LKLGLLTAIGTGVAGATKSGSALNDPDAASTVRLLRKVSYALALGELSSTLFRVNQADEKVVVGVLIIAVVSTHITFGLDVRKTGFNLIAALFLLVVAVYRVAQCFSTNPDSAARSDAAFWILMVLFEL